MAGVHPPDHPRHRQARRDRPRQDTAIEYGSGPMNGWDRRINHLGGGRGVYVRDPDGHSYELFTAVPG